MTEHEDPSQEEEAPPPLEAEATAEPKWPDTSKDGGLRSPPIVTPPRHQHDE